MKKCTGFSRLWGGPTYIVRQRYENVQSVKNEMLCNLEIYKIAEWFYRWRIVLNCEELCKCLFRMSHWATISWYHDISYHDKWPSSYHIILNTDSIFQKYIISYRYWYSLFQNYHLISKTDNTFATHIILNMISVITGQYLSSRD